MKIFIIGSGGREHAIGCILMKDNPHAQLFFAPGNAGTAHIGINIDIDVSNTIALTTFALEQQMDMTIVGPELPLSLGLVNQLRAVGVAAFGPTKQAAQLESSKAFSKKFMQRYQIPTADYQVFTEIKQAQAYLDNTLFPVVIKADGLAAGKGVIICHTKQEAQIALSKMMEQKIFGQQGETIIIESFLAGNEVSILCFIDGKTIIPMASASDYKRALDDDKGLNTGGMGSISPSFFDTTDPRITQIIQNTLTGIQQEHFDYRGVIYIGLMLTTQGPMVLEYNVRFGDPETQALLPRLKTSLFEVITAVEQQKLSQTPITWSDDHCVTIVIASKGYPEDYLTGQPIVLPIAANNVLVFHNGTIKKEAELLSHGGRVLSISAVAPTMKQAREACYNYIQQIQFDAGFYRHDIGLNRIEPKK